MHSLKGSVASYYAQRLKALPMSFPVMMTPVYGTTGRTVPTAAALRQLLTRNYRLRLNLSLGFNEYLPRIASPAAGILSKPVLPRIQLSFVTVHNPSDSEWLLSFYKYIGVR